ncbi:MAG: TPM domain-containing protein, partial [Gemmatimonadota bacterium]|nr:TPM domain-containing protein [Gemmatimonadota bacterium]
MRASLAKAILTALGLQLAWSGAVLAQTGVDSLFPARPSGYITDLSQVISGPIAERITAKIQLLRDRTGAEIAVVTLPSIGDRAAVDVAVAIGRVWGVGSAAAVGDARRNAGIVVLLVPRRDDDPNSGQIFIATGQGVEGFVTDAAAGRVRDAMRPSLSRGEYGDDDEDDHDHDDEQRQCHRRHRRTPLPRRWDEGGIGDSESPGDQSGKGIHSDLQPLAILPAGQAGPHGIPDAAGSRVGHESFH